MPQANTGPDPEGTDEVMRHRDRSHLTQITCTNNKLGPAWRESKGAMYIIIRCFSRLVKQGQYERERESRITW